MLAGRASEEVTRINGGSTALLVSERNALSEIELFKDLDTTALVQIDQACRYRRYSALEQIIDSDAVSTDVYFIVRGRARVVTYSMSGREITFADLQPGDYFGEVAAIDGGPRSAGVMATEDTLVMTLPRRQFLALLADYPQLALQVMRRLTHIVRRADERIMDLSTMAANNRVQAELLRQARSENTLRKTAVIEPIPIHSDIASRVSTTRETVARVLNELARKGIVERTRTALVIRDLPRLRMMVEEVRG